MSKEELIVENLEVNKATISIKLVPDGYKLTRWGRLKTKVWNFILPPHIRLEMKDE